MTQEAWWEEALAGWASAARQTYTLHPYTGERPNRGFGEWWKDGDTWCLHLSSRLFATFTDELSSSLRGALTWTLRHLAQSSAGSRQSVAVSRLTQLMTASRNDLESLLSGDHATDRTRTDVLPSWRGPGCYILVEPTEPNDGTEDTVTLLAEVVEAVLPGARLGEVELIGQVPKLLLFYPQKELDRRMAAANGTTRRDTDVLREALSELADALESDAMVPCTLWLSRLAKQPDETASALLTLALMWQARHHLSTRRNVHIWGEQPIQVLLVGLPQQVRKWFVEAARAGEPLPDDLSEALTGLIAANLNVSEAARRLYVHRNTLIHRIERIRELTGYDVRNFWEALPLWLQETLRDRQNGQTP